MLVSQSRALPTGPPLWVTEREVPSRLRPALTLAKPRILGGSGPDLSPVPKNYDITLVVYPQYINILSDFHQNMKRETLDVLMWARVNREKRHAKLLS